MRKPPSAFLRFRAIGQYQQTSAYEAAGPKKPDDADETPAGEILSMPNQTS